MLQRLTKKYMIEIRRIEIDWQALVWRQTCVKTPKTTGNSNICSTGYILATPVLCVLCEGNP